MEGRTGRVRSKACVGCGPEGGFGWATRGVDVCTQGPVGKANCNNPSSWAGCTWQGLAVRGRNGAKGAQRCRVTTGIRGCGKRPARGPDRRPPHGCPEHGRGQDGAREIFRVHRTRGRPLPPRPPCPIHPSEEGSTPSSSLPRIRSHTQPHPCSTLHLQLDPCAVIVSKSLT